MSLTEAELLDDVRERLFAPTTSPNPRAIGLELELIPIHEPTRTRALARSDEQVSTADVMSRLAAREGWREESNEIDPPSWRLKDGSRISFEPGGQIEISTAPHATASAVIDTTQSLVATMREAMAKDAIELIARGVDPYNDIDAVPLQLHRARYANMTHYFDSIGPAGVQMMRQTAALQINVERGEDPRSRWRLLNALAPFVVALFANSRDYARRSTGWASYRAELWRALDRSRTGIIYDDSRPAERYLEFALNAIAMRGGDGSPHRRFRELMQDSAVGTEDWLFHLSTLFPEVRPKEFFELRSADTIEPQALAAPVVLVTGLIYDKESARRAAQLLGAPSEDLLERAGRLGLADTEIRSTAAQVIGHALDGAQRLGSGYIAPAHIAVAEQYFARTLSAADI